MLAGMMQVSRAEKYQRMRELLNEKQWRHYLALEAQECGSVMLVAHEAGVSHNTIRRGLQELEAVREGSRTGLKQHGGNGSLASPARGPSV
jgi:hypothetical protein